MTLNRAWWPNFPTKVEERSNLTRKVEKGVRLLPCANATVTVFSNSASIAKKAAESTDFVTHVRSWLVNVPLSEGIKIGITLKSTPIMLQLTSMQGKREGRDEIDFGQIAYLFDDYTRVEIRWNCDNDSAATASSDDDVNSSIPLGGLMELSPSERVRRLGFGGYAEQVKSALSVMWRGLFPRQEGAVEQNNILFKPPRGILLHGPPGTGKSLLARCLVNALQVDCIELSHDVLLSTHVGDAEIAITSVFSQAWIKQPCVVLIDDADILLRSRSQAGTSLQKGVVSALLTLIDGIDGSGNVSGSHGGINHGISDLGTAVPPFILAISARPQDLDPAMRRPGRLDVELELPAPNSSERYEILHGILQSMNVPVESNIAPKAHLTEKGLSAVATNAHGMVGADLLQVIKQAFLQGLMATSIPKEKEADALVGQMASLSLKNDIVCPKSAATVAPQVSDASLLAALPRVPPSALREVVLEMPRVEWDDIGGMLEVKEGLQEVVEWPLKYPQLFSQLGLSPPQGVLLYGPPGCSKTLMAKALATQSCMNFLSVRGPELLSKWLGESEKAIQTLFRRARAASPCIVFFDEIDALAGKRGSGSSGVSDRVLAQLLTELDGISSNRALAASGVVSRVILVAATNRPDVLDTALMRPGRIDRKIYVPPPDGASREQILRLHLGKMPCDEGILTDGISLARLVELTNGYSGAEMVALTTEGAMLAVDKGRDVLSMEDLLEARNGIVPQITQEMLSFYERFKDSV